MAADGSIVVGVELDDKKAQAELNRLGNSIERLREKVRRATNERMPLLEQAEQLGVALDAAKAKLDEMQNAPAGTYSAEQISAQKENVSVLQGQWNAVQKQVEAYDRQIEKANRDIAYNEERAGELSAQLAGVGSSGAAAGEEVARAGGVISEAMQRATEKVEKLANRIAGLVKRVFVFSLITRALRSVRQYLSEAVKSNDEAAAAIARLKGALATLAQPILQVVIPAFTALINIITKVISAIASIVSLLTGSSFSASTKAAEAYENEKKALKGVGGAAKDASKQLANFDEINKLAGEDEGGGGGGGAAEALGFDFSGEELDLPIIGKIKELFESLDFTNIKESLAGLKESFRGLADTIGAGLGWAWDNILAPLAHWVIEKAAPKLIDALAAAFDFLKAVLEKLGPILEPFWENVLKPLLEFAGDAILTVLDELTDLLNDLTDLINGDISFEEFISGLDGIQIAILALGGFAVLNAIGGFVTTMATNFAKLPGIVSNAASTVATKLGALAKTVAVGALAVADAVLVAYDVKALKEASDTYKDAMDAHTRETETALSTYQKLYEEKGKEVADEWAKMVYNIDTSADDLETAQKRIAGEIEKHWDGVPQNMWEGFKQGWEYYFGVDGVGLLQLLKDAFQGAINGIKELLGIHSPSTVFSDIGSDVAQGLWDGFKEVWDKFTSWIEDGWNKVVEWWNTNLAPVFTLSWWEDKFSVIGEAIKAPINAVLSGLESAVNWIIDKLNSLAFDVPDWVPRVGGKHFGINIPYVSVPQLAAGAVIPPNSEFLAVLGDQKSGTNIEAPLETILAAFRQALSEANSDRELVMKIGEYEFGRLVFNAFNTENSRIGTAMVR